MKRWMKWAAVGAVALAAVPVMGLTMIPAKTPATKTPARPAAKVSHVSATSTAKKTMKLAAKPVIAKTAVMKMSPRPASVRLGKNALPVKLAKLHGQVSTLVHATPVNKKPVLVTKTPMKPTTLHTGPAKLPTPRSTLNKAMERTHTPSSPMKSKTEMN